MINQDVFWGRRSRERGLQWRGVGWVGTREGHGGSAKDDWVGQVNPNRRRGFWQNRFETPSLNEMKAKQGAIVAKLMTFFQRKCTLVIEMYVA